MKTKNFPEKKNKRRKGALSRLKGDTPIKQLEEVALASRIVNNARSVRTKIRREQRP